MSDINEIQNPVLNTSDLSGDIQLGASISGVVTDTSVPILGEISSVVDITSGLNVSGDIDATLDASGDISAALRSSGNITGSVDIGSFIINDYLLELVRGESEYVLSIKRGTQTQTAVIQDAVSITGIEQIESSEEDSGRNVMRITLSNGDVRSFIFYNGSKGDKGDPGISSEEKEELNEAEAAREYSEEERQANERIRIANEERRDLLERLRQGEEAERVQQEKNRRKGETERHYAEETRIGGEDFRRDNEGMRIENEVNRQSGWEELSGALFDSISYIVDLQDRVIELSGKVEGATADVRDAVVDVNNLVTESEDMLLTGEIKQAILNCFAYVWPDDNKALYNNLAALFGIDVN